MIRRLATYILAIVMASALFSASAVAGDAISKARVLQADYQDAVIWVEGVLKMQISMQGQTDTRDQEVEALATVICPEGLAVVPKSSLNPSSMIGRMMHGSGMGMTGMLTDVKMIMPDGREISAEVVLEDDVLDISIIAPNLSDDEDDPVVFKHVDLSKAQDVAILDQVINLARLPKYMNRQEAVSLHRIGSIIQRPRKFYMANNIASVGTPVFDMAGKLVGVTVIRTPPRMDLSGIGGDGLSLVILPTSDLQELAGQAREELDSHKK